MEGPTEANSFVEIPLSKAAQALSQVLTDESTDALFTYDPGGGYGHRDHVRAHQVAQLAADLADVPVVYQVTVDRRLLLHAVRIAHWLNRADDQLQPSRFRTAFTDPHHITHRIGVNRFAEEKRRALLAHTSQLGGGEATRTIALMTRLPKPVFRAVLGTEWFVMQLAKSSAADILAEYRLPRASTG
jgi:LmbE family N-acetylglucosaminyl deacetylase